MQIQPYPQQAQHVDLIRALQTVGWPVEEERVKPSRLRNAEELECRRPEGSAAGSGHEHQPENKTKQNM